MGAIAPNDYNYQAIEKTVKGAGQVQSLTDTILPSIKALLTPSADNPTLQAIDRSTSRNVASAQTESMKRGLTGSDIEAGAMGMERQTGEMAKSSFFADSAGKLAGFMKELATGDINTQRENIIMMAQLMGQKLQSEQDIQMFREQLAANMEQAGKNRESGMWGGLIGLGGQLGSAAIMGSTGGAAAPVVGALKSKG
jgi:rRNA maturation endonuclease Nob1